jgi:uncharacterized repeat protein (TIGR01451 family)
LANPEPVHGAWGVQESVAAIVYATKSVALVTDSDGNGAITPGDTLRYNVKIYNIGNVDALGAALTDILPANTTYAVAWTATNGTVSYSAPQISWTGFVTADPTGVIKTEITFDVTVNSVPLGTVVSNQGTVSYDSDNDGTNDPAADILTDGDPYMAGIQTTDFTVGGSAQATGIKTAALAVDADLNGVITPGDTLEYTIVITNMTGFTPVAGIEFTDVIPLHTTYVAGSTTVTDYVVPLPLPHSDHTIVINEPLPPVNPNALVITGIDIGPVSSPPDNVVTIKFRVMLDSPMAPGVTQISNQGVGFYDSNSDGINDTHQTTDGDLGTVGNQPTLTNLYIGTISGTVFDDLDGDGSLDVGEPGLSGVTVRLYDVLFAMLYGTTTTDINGYYAFTALLPGNYGVRETDPAFYVPTTLNDVTPVTLNPAPPTGDSEVVHFGDEKNGDADLEITKHCSTLGLDGTFQLAYILTVTNNGTTAAANVVLTDVLTALAASGLSGIRYTEDGGALTAWPVTNTLSWGSIASGASHEIRIFANVAETFAPVENFASVTSDTYDPDTTNNTTSCLNAVCRGIRRAIQFENPACTACSDTCPPADANVSIPDYTNSTLDLTTSGTIEAWIQATSCTESDADAGIVMKGTANACYGFGLAGGTLFPGGTPQNIGFLVDDSVLVADGYTLTPGKWYHIACTWSAGSMNIYINGLLEETGPGDVAPTNDEALMLGQQTIVPTPSNGQYFGVIEEFRLWNIARTQADIQNDMCRTLTLLTIPATDLVCYLKYDECRGDEAVDASGNGNDGDTSHAARVCSEAPVGDESFQPPDYSGAVAADFTASLVSSGGETLTVTGDGGTWSAATKSGLQVYRVNDAPGAGNGPLGTRLFDDRGYFGVFVTGGEEPTYSVTYDYNDAGIGDEGGLDLLYRHHGCAPWSRLDITLPNRDTSANTLTQPLMSGTEYILGKNVEPRNAIFYDGTDDYVGVPDNFSLDLTDTGTLEAWINISAPTPNGGIIHKGDNTNLSDEAYFLTLNAAGNRIVLGVNNGGGPITVTSSTLLNTGVWYHVAGVFDFASSVLMQIYINGVLDCIPVATLSAQNSGGGLNIGQQFTAGVGSFEPFNGSIDEVRVWDVVRNQNDIQSAMCRKLTGLEAGLVGYWRFDDETNSTACPDYTANNNDGTMTNFGTNPVGAGLDPIREYRVCSSAPIGDDSASSYASPFSTTLAHGDGDYMFATANAASVTAGGWSSTSSGIHVYRVDEAPAYPPDLWEDAYYDYLTPNGLTPPANLTAPIPPNNWSSIDYYRYWGVFLTDPTSGGAPSEPFYDLMYYYDGDPVNLLDGNPNVPDNADGTAGNPRIGLAKRPDYCFGTWTDSTANWNVPSLRLELGNQGQNTPKTNPEYVMGGINAPLAITLASFTATPDNGCVNVAWETATEINTAGFHVWRSDNPLTGFVRITGSLIASTSGMETMGAKYGFRDCGVDFSTGTKYYYMLEEIEMDTIGSGNMHGPIGPVSENVTAAQGDGGSNDKACFIGSLGWWEE